MNTYQEKILDHYHNPRHRDAQTITCADHTYCAEHINTSCGDQLTIALDVADNIITDLHWTGDGCAISQAGASILTEYLHGKTIDNLREMTKDDMFALLELPISPARTKCALLALETAQNALNNTHL